MTYILLIIGFVLLIKGADFFVEGSSKIARKLQIPPLLVGLTIVAFGTSSPEGTVSIIAALEGNSDLTLGNLVGSNILNMSLVVGLTAIISPLKVENDTIRKEIPFTFLASIALVVFMSDVILQGADANAITRGDGLILLLFFTIFMYYIYEAARNSKDKGLGEEMVPEGTGTWTMNTVMTIGGLVAIIFGGHFVVDSSVTIALLFGMSEALVGLTIVAIGTSLPELITSITAAMKNHSDIALGNIVGSSIFNILFVLGIASSIAPLPVNDKLFFDVTSMLLFTIVLFIFALTQCKVSKREGFVLSLAYILYLIYIIMRN
ncbi:MAG: calcium/sodium antiporter [Bacillus sp. (in: Bacteria)]|nr:calcium/sodium antiporter [Bacillus sp. (in: firmicutes)]